MASSLPRAHSRAVTATPAVFPLASVLQHANARITIIFDPDSDEAREIQADIGIVKIVVETDHPQSIDEVAGIVTHIIGVIRLGLGVSIFCPQRLEVSELVAACAAVVLGAPSHAVVGELAQLPWIDFGSYIEFAEDFLEFCKERRLVA